MYIDTNKSKASADEVRQAGCLGGAILLVLFFGWLVLSAVIWALNLDPELPTKIPNPATPAVLLYLFGFVVSLGALYLLVCKGRWVETLVDYQPTEMYAIVRILGVSINVSVFSVVGGAILIVLLKPEYNTVLLTYLAMGFATPMFIAFFTGRGDIKGTANALLNLRLAGNSYANMAINLKRGDCSVGVTAELLLLAKAKRSDVPQYLLDAGYPQSEVDMLQR